MNLYMNTVGSVPVHRRSRLVVYSVLKSYFSLKKLIGFDKANVFLQPIFTFSYAEVLLETKICALKRCWIRHSPPTAYWTWQVIPNYWKLANCWSISSLTLMFAWIYRTIEILFVCFVFFFFLHNFFSHLSALHVSFLTPTTLSAVRTSTLTHTRTQITHSVKTSRLSHFHAHTTPVAISATLLTGANQSYNTFIISTPPQALSCWVKSHLGLFGCFTALEICNYIMDMGEPGLAGSSHWQLDTKQTRCELYRTPQTKKTKVFLIPN